MLNFFTRYFFPKEIAIKKGSLQRLKFLNLKNPILFYSTSAEKNGFVEKIKAMFPEMKLYKINSREPKLDDIRNLEDFSVNLDTSIRLNKTIPTTRLVISESGIKTSKDIKLLADNGIRTFLIGEIFMGQDCPGQALKKLLSSWTESD